jgi:hypothetical protein
LAELRNDFSLCGLRFSLDEKDGLLLTLAVHPEDDVEEIAKASRRVTGFCRDYPINTI